MKTGVIYIATNIITNKSYIGQTIKSLNERIAGHYISSRLYNRKFTNALIKYKREDWVWKVLHKDIQILYLNEMEKFYIFLFDTYKSGYNSTIGGEDNPMNSPETRMKLSILKSGNKYPNLSRALKGRKHTEKHSKNIAISKKGKKYPNIASANAKKTYKIIRPDGIVDIIKNLKEYCRMNNLNNGNMYKIIDKKNNHKGYRVEIVDIK